MLLRYPEKPLTIIQLWKMSFNVSKASFSALYFLLLPYSLFISLLLIFSKKNGNIPPDIQHAKYWVLGLLVMAGVSGIMAWTATTYRIGLFLEGKTSSYIHTMKAAVNKFPQTAILFLLVIILLFLGIILFILPGIYFSIAASIVMPILIFENRGPFDAIKGSLQLVWGNWWRTWFIIIVLKIIIYALYGLIMFMLGFFMGMMHLKTAYIVNFMQIFLLPVPLIFIFPIYLLIWHDLRLRKNLAQIPQV